MDNSTHIMFDFRRHSKALSWLTLVSFLGQLSVSIAGGIIADPSAPGQQRPTVLQTANGVPLVNIQTPSAAGVSHNTYQQFNVHSQGAILNNARENTQTQLGGWVQGNPSLAGGTARIILNEINSLNPSQLNGFVEVGGSKAQVVIANPAGINCDGCGFINANKATLTTGSPIFKGGNLDGYLVDRGAITINGAGLDSRQTDYTDIIARSVQVNSDIWANNLNVTAGANNVNAAQTTITPIAGTATTPTIAIDVSALGGMYAGKIHLVGTENGVGVSNAGNIGASAGEFTLTANGTLINTGHISSNTQTTIDTTGNITNSGTLYSKGNSAVSSNGIVNNSGTLAAKTNNNVNATDIISSNSSVLAAGINTDGTIGTTGNLSLTASNAISAQGQNIAADNLSIKGQSLDLTSSETSAQHLNLTASNGNLTATNATLSSADTMTINASGTLNTTGAKLIASNNLAINSGALNGDGDLLSHGDLTVQLAHDYTHTGLIQADENVTLTSSGIITNQSNISARKALNVTAATIDNHVSGQISAASLQLNATDTHSLINRGLIDGKDTFLEAITFNNLGTGRIYGDHIAIAATTFINDAEGGIAPVIAARNQLDIGATTMTNNEHALLFSAGDLSIGGGLDPSHMAVGQTLMLNNTSATIEALGDLKIAATTLNNTNAHFSSTLDLTTTTFYEDHMGQDCSSFYAMPGCRGNHKEDHTYHNFTQHLYTPVVSNSDPAKILAGGSLSLYGANLTNDKSQIIAAGLLQGDLANLTNIAAQGIKKTTLIDSYSIYQKTSSGYKLRGPFTRTLPISEITVTLPVTKTEGYSTVGGTETHISAHTTNSVENVTVTTTLPNNSLFQTQTNPASRYLIETDPLFTHYRSWLSSDYMLTQLAYDPATTLKRLGDGFYEQKLIRDQLAQLTGRQFIDGYNNDEAQYQALMMQGVTFANAYQLVPGVALTQAQVAQLTSDIVWLVEQSVTLADGTVQQVLVPQVYMRPIEGELHLDGTLIAGGKLNLNLTNDLSNSGTIAGRTIAAITAENINNLGGKIAANNTSLIARNDINNIGGSISAGDSLLLSADRDINITSTTSTSTELTANSEFNRTGIDRIAGLYVSNSKGILVASAGNDMTLTAAAIINSGSEGQTSLSANNDLKLATLTESKLNSVTWDARNYGHLASSNEVGTSIQTQGDLTLAANNDIRLRAATVSSEQGAISATAGNNLTIETGQATRDEDSAHYTKKSGFLSSRSKSKRDTLNESLAISSSLSGEKITLHAGNDITVSGSNVVATNDTTIHADNNLIIEAAQQTHDETHLYKKSKSGVFSSGGIGFTVGNQKLATTSGQQQLTNIASTIGSLEGNVKLEAGKAYQQTGSDVLALQGDIDINAQKVDIEAATDLFANEHTTKFKQTGITVAITSPVISAIQTAQQMSQAASQTSDSRMHLLAAGTVALSAKNAANATMNTLNAPASQAGGLTGSATDAANQVGGINLSLSLGTSKSSGTSTQTNTSTTSSHLTAGGDIHIKATGADTNTGATSDINIIGSQVKANGDVTLSADNNLNLLAASNTSKLDSNNKNSSASIGMSVGSSGIAATASSSAGKGKEKGNGTTWTETVIQSGNQAGDKVTLNSGADTNLIGAQVAGNQVIANVGTTPITGGNLNIQSLQDTDQYNAQQKSQGFSVSIPIGAGAVGGSISASSSKTKSNYQSVQEQAGIFAGDGGFQVNVAGNTDLKGAVIASTDKAVQDNKNSLTTQTLTTSNIENKAKYDAKAASTTIGGGLKAGLPQLSGAGLGSDSGKESSTTVSAISVGTLNITKDSDELSKAAINRDVYAEADTNGNLIAVNSQGNNLANTVKPIFDAEKVAREIQAQVTITQAFNQQANQALGTYVQTKRQNLQQQLKAATTPEAKAVIQSQLSELRIEEQVMNVLIGAVGGMGGTAITKEGLSLAADEMRQLMIKDSVKFAGVTDVNGNTLDNIAAESEGVRLDGKKVGGTRVDLDLLCGAMNERCATQKNPDKTLILDDNDIPKLALNEKGQVEFLGNLNDFIKTPEGQEMVGPTGGIQGLIGTLFGKEYKAGSWQDKLIESFSGTHDFIGGSLSGLYDEQGNATRGRSDFHKVLNDRWAEVAIPLAAPFAASEFLPPEVWQAISILLKGAK